jgi:GT2 family glycosyltransferase
MSAAPSISVVIVNFNGEDLLPECLESLRSQTCRDFEVILVDNNSSDGSAALVEARYPEVKLVRNSDNLGYGGGNNAGIAVATGTYIALLNNDTATDPRWLERLVAPAVNDPTVGMCASKILNYYDRGVIDNTGLLMYRDGVARGRGRLERDTGQYEREEEIFFPSGCACLFRREVFDREGGFDEDFFLYVDDVDMGLRARWAGWRCVYAPGAVVYHKYSATTEAYSTLKAFLVERNRIWVMIKYFPAMMILASLWHTLLRYALQGYGIVTGRGAGSRLVQSGSVLGGVGTLVRAYASALGGVGTMCAKRRRIMARRRVSAAVIRGWFRDYGISAAELALKE